MGKTNYIDGEGKNGILGVIAHENSFRYKSFGVMNLEPHLANLAAIWLSYKFFLV